MTVNDLLRALERRGYQVRFMQPCDETGKSIFLCISLKRGGMDGFMTRPFYVKELAAVRVASYYLDFILSPFSAGQYHVQHRCPENMAGYPLLSKSWRGIRYRGKVVPMTRELCENLRVGYWEPIEVHDYRSVSAGPESEPLKVCPRCKGEISIETVQEFDDENTDGKTRALPETFPAEWVE
jgi:hypothetical protein